MSDQPMGHGWWQASDGKWYPPESASPSAGTQQPSSYDQRASVTHHAEEEQPHVPFVMTPIAGLIRAVVGGFAAAIVVGLLLYWAFRQAALHGWWMGGFAFQQENMFVAVLVPVIGLVLYLLATYFISFWATDRHYFSNIATALYSSALIMSVVYLVSINAVDGLAIVGGDFLSEEQTWWIVGAMVLLALLAFYSAYRTQKTPTRFSSTFTPLIVLLVVLGAQILYQTSSYNSEVGLTATQPYTWAEMRKFEAISRLDTDRSFFGGTRTVPTLPDGQETGDQNVDKCLRERLRFQIAAEDTEEAVQLARSRGQDFKERKFDGEYHSISVDADGVITATVSSSAPC